MTPSQWGSGRAVALRLCTPTAEDRALLAQFVAEGPVHTRAGFGQEPSSRDVEAVLGGAPEGALPGAHRVLGAFLGTGALAGVVQ